MKSSPANNSLFVVKHVFSLVAGVQPVPEKLMHHTARVVAQALVLLDEPQKCAVVHPDAIALALEMTVKPGLSDAINAVADFGNLNVGRAQNIVDRLTVDRSLV